MVCTQATSNYDYIKLDKGTVLARSFGSSKRLDFDLGRVSWQLSGSGAFGPIVKFLDLGLYILKGPTYLEYLT